jgi:hypothetical protein
MKTLAKIILTALVILMANSTYADSYRKFRMLIAGDKEIYVISKLENIVEEYLPYHPNVSRYISPSLMKHIKAGQAGGENLVYEMKKQAVITDEQIQEVVRSMQTEEPLADEHDIDTHEIFEEFKHNHTFELTNEILARFVKEEKEITEDSPILSMSNKRQVK